MQFKSLRKDKNIIAIYILQKQNPLMLGIYTLERASCKDLGCMHNWEYEFSGFVLDLLLIGWGDVPVP